MNSKEYWHRRNSRRNTRKHYRHPLLEPFEPRLLFSTSFSTSDISGTLVMTGLNTSGSLTATGAGAFSDGSWKTPDVGSSYQLVGDESSYSLSPDGAFSAEIVTTQNGTAGTITTAFVGAMNTRKDVIIANEMNGDVPLLNGLDTFVGQNALFTQDDFTGTWNVIGDKFRGSIIINASGQITGGTLTLLSNQKSARIIGGTAPMDNDGGGYGTLLTTFSGIYASYASIDFAFVMNNSKDFVALQNHNLGMGGTSGFSVMTALIRTATTNSRADLAGLTWAINSAQGIGSLTLTATGTVTGQLTDTDGIISTLGGSYSLGSKGAVTLNLSANSSTGTSRFTFSGALNRSQNIIALDLTAKSTQSSLTFLTTAGNHAPTLDAKDLFPQSTHIATPMTMSFSDIVTALHIQDADNDTTSLLITAVPANSGTLTLTHEGDTSDVIPGSTVISAGDFLTWTSSSTAKGKVNAFSVQASDGVASSTQSGALFVSTLPHPAVSIKTSRANAYESQAGTPAAKGFYTISRAGDASVPLTITLSVGGTAARGTNYNLVGPDTTILIDDAPTVTIPAHVASIKVYVDPLEDDTLDPQRTVTLTIASDPNALTPAYVPGSKNTANINLFDSARQITITAAKSSITEGAANVTAFIITRSAPPGRNLNGTNTVNISYAGSTFDTANHFTAPASVTFNPGETRKTILVTTTDDGTADPTQTLVATISSTSASSTGTGTATINVLDSSPVVTLTASPTTLKEGSANSTRIVLSRTGDLTADLPVTLNFSADSTASTLGTNFIITDPAGNPVTTATTIPAGKKSLTLTLAPIDDFTNDPAFHVTAALQPDPSHVYNISTRFTAAITILNKDRRPIVANRSATFTTPADTPLSLSFDQLVTAMGATLDPANIHGTLQLRVTSASAGILQVTPSGSDTPLAAPVGTLLNAGDTLLWTPPAATGTLNAFTLAAVDGTLASALATRFNVTLI
jgi:hypothetical protein